MNVRTKQLLATGVAVATMLVGACGSDDAADGSAQPVTEVRDDAARGQAVSLSIRDAWVKAEETGMTAAFGVLVNDGDEDVVVTASTSEASPVMELHETVEDPSGEMVMREKDGGFLIPAGGEYLLQPGANHLMLMELGAPILAGEEVSFGLVLDDGSTFEFSAMAKDFSGANERYVEDE